MVALTFQNFVFLLDGHINPIPTGTKEKERLAKMERFLRLSKDLNQVDEDTFL